MQIKTIAALRVQLAAIGRAAGSRAPCLPFDLPALDAYLPGGLALGAVHEVSAGGLAVEHAAAPALFAAGMLARLPGPVLWVLAACDLYLPALARAGLHPARVVFVHTRDGALRAMEEGLRHPGLAGVVCKHAGAGRPHRLPPPATGRQGQRCAGPPAEPPAARLHLAPGAPPRGPRQRSRSHRRRVVGAPAEVAAGRDYWAVEIEDGRRSWLFRQGNGLDPVTDGFAWFLHGLF